MAGVSQRAKLENTHLASEAGSPPFAADSSTLTRVGGAPLRAAGTSTVNSSSENAPDAADAAARA
jgi:hypothetical protein